jgi:hypothetical protein
MPKTRDQIREEGHKLKAEYRDLSRRFFPTRILARYRR